MVAGPSLKIAYFGLPLGALLLLRDGHRLTLCALPNVAAPGARRLERKLDVPVRRANDSNALEAAVDADLARDAPDLIVSWFWTRKLPARWLAAARYGAIGCHPSLLPRHRGANPYFWAIDSGDDETGVSVHRLEAEYDTGDVLAQARLSIGERNAWQLARALDRPSLALLRRTVRDFAEGHPPLGTPQDEARATQAPEPEGALLHVDFRWPSERVLRRIRALSPVPGLALAFADTEFFVTRAKPVATFVTTLVPGEAELRERLLLRTADGAISVERAALTEDDGLEVSGEELARRLAERLESRRSGPFKGEGR